MPELGTGRYSKVEMSSRGDAAYMIEIEGQDQAEADHVVMVLIKAMLDDRTQVVRSIAIEASHAAGVDRNK